MSRALIAVVLWSGCWNPPDDLVLVDEIPLVGTGACAPPREVRVGCVLDGDTFDLVGCGDPAERVRLLGIDAPEIAHDGTPAECWGDEAWDALRRLVDARTVSLTFDEECTGVYGRTLAYAWIGADDVDLAPDEVEAADGVVLLNELLLARGHARLYDEAWTGELRLEARLVAAEAEAQARGLGLWSACTE